MHPESSIELLIGSSIDWSMAISNMVPEAAPTSAPAVALLAKLLLGEKRAAVYPGMIHAEDHKINITGALSSVLDKFVVKNTAANSAINAEAPAAIPLGLKMLILQASND